MQKEDLVFIEEYTTQDPGLYYKTSNQCIGDRIIFHTLTQILVPKGTKIKRFYNHKIMVEELYVQEAEVRNHYRWSKMWRDDIPSLDKHFVRIDKEVYPTSFSRWKWTPLTVGKKITVNDEEFKQEGGIKCYRKRDAARVYDYFFEY